MSRFPRSPESVAFPALETPLVGTIRLSLVSGVALSLFVVGCFSPTPATFDDDDGSSGTETIASGTSASGMSETTSVDGSTSEYETSGRSTDGTAGQESSSGSDGAVCGDGLVQGSETCDGDGEGTPGETAACNVDCTTSVCGDGVLNVAAGEGCDDGDEDDFDRCSSACIPAASEVLSGNHLFDTDTGRLDGIARDSWDPVTSTWHLSGLEIRSSAVLTVVGNTSLSIEVDGVVEIAGTIDAAGQDGGTPSVDTASCGAAGLGGIPGPGGFAGGDGAGYGGTETEDGAPGFGPGSAPAGGGVASSASSGNLGGAGGGGGGHLNAGSPGSENVNVGTIAGVGGQMHPSLLPLIGGGGGGGGSVEKDGQTGVGALEAVDDEGSGGGGGGGGISIVSTVSITVTGLIDVSGGAGGSDDGCDHRGLGGGGAGGTIILSSPNTDTTLGVLDVSGGLGGVTNDSVGAPFLNGGNGSVGVAYVGSTGFGACVPMEGGACLGAEGCLTDDPEDPMVGVCTQTSCQDVSECPPPPLASGTAPLVCRDVSGDMVGDCILDCSDGQLCPEGMECFAGNLCAWPT